MSNISKILLINIAILIGFLTVAIKTKSYRTQVNSLNTVIKQKEVAIRNEQLKYTYLTSPKYLYTKNMEYLDLHPPSKLNILRESDL